MDKLINGCLISALIVVTVLIIGGSSFISHWKYSSPVLEAGREYQQTVESFENKGIENMDDIYERLAVLDKHFASETFDKMHGGDRTKVKLADIETLFGPPHKKFEDTAMTSIQNVYQYYFENQILSFHENQQAVSEYIWEDYNEETYTESELDALFIELLTASKEEENAFKASNYLESRRVTQNGWREWAYRPQVYFDTGQGDFAPEEYLVLNFKPLPEEGMNLSQMERRYHEGYQAFYSQSEMEDVEELFREISSLLNENREAEGQESISIADLDQVFGEKAKIIYSSRNNSLEISWLVLGDSYMQEIIAQVDGSDWADFQLRDISDLSKLLVSDFDYNYIYNSQIRTDHFMMSH